MVQSQNRWSWPAYSGPRDEDGFPADPPAVSTNAAVSTNTDEIIEVRRWTWPAYSGDRDHDGYPTSPCPSAHFEEEPIQVLDQTPTAYYGSCDNDFGHTEQSSTVCMDCATGGAVGIFDKMWQMQIQEAVVAKTNERSCTARSCSASCRASHKEQSCAVSSSSVSTYAGKEQEEIRKRRASAPPAATKEPWKEQEEKEEKERQASSRRRGLSATRATLMACNRKAQASLFTDALDHILRERRSLRGEGVIVPTYKVCNTSVDDYGRRVNLENKHVVLQVLHELGMNVATPICQHFGLQPIAVLGEQPCQEKKAGVTQKQMYISDEDSQEEIAIKIRLRVHPSKGDPHSQFISIGTQLAILLHELAHVRHMNHNIGFMLFLRDIFAFARQEGLFDPSQLTNEIPSPWPWENEIFCTGGDIVDEELLCLFHKYAAVKSSACNCDASCKGSGKSKTAAPKRKTAKAKAKKRSTLPPPRWH